MMMIKPGNWEQKETVTRKGKNSAVPLLALANGVTGRIKEEVQGKVGPGVLF